MSLCNLNISMQNAKDTCDVNPSGIKRAWVITLSDFVDAGYSWETVNVDVDNINKTYIHLIDSVGEVKNFNINNLKEIIPTDDTASVTSTLTKVGRDNYYWTNTFTATFDTSEYAAKSSNSNSEIVFGEYIVFYETYDGNQYIIVPTEKFATLSNMFFNNFDGMKITQFDVNTGANPTSDEATITMTLTGEGLLPPMQLNKKYITK